MIVQGKLEQLVCRQTDSLHEAIRKITELGDPLTFQVIVDDDGRPVGTVTDGDIRRAFLQGASLESEISASMHAAPVTAPANTSEAELRDMSATLRVGFLPLVADNGRLEAVYFPKEDGQRRHIALVMAGGRGQRLGTRTEVTPKPLLDVRGKPMLGHILDRLEEAGINEIMVSVHYLGEQIEAFVKNRTSSAEVRVIREDAPLGTAGSVGLIGAVNAPVLVLNGDVLTSVDFRAMGTFHDKHAHDTTIAVARHAVQIPFGVVQHDAEGLFQGIVEKPSISHFISAGIYQLSPETCALVTEGETLDMPQLLNRARSAGLKVGLFPIHERWMDVGQPKDLEAAQDAEWASADNQNNENA